MQAWEMEDKVNKDYPLEILTTWSLSYPIPAYSLEVVMRIHRRYIVTYYRISDNKKITASYPNSAMMQEWIDRKVKGGRHHNFSTTVEFYNCEGHEACC